jgi:hypothetical protein
VKFHVHTALLTAEKEMKLKNAFLSTLNNICKENYDTRCSKIFYRTKKS